MIRSLELYDFFRGLASVIAPNRCPFCEAVIPANKFYCESCPKFLPFITKPVSPPENVSRIFACCYCRQRAREAVLRFKYKNEFYPADAFALMISEKLAGVKADVIVPVPSSRKSVKTRGYATAEIMGKRIAMRLGVRCIQNLLVLAIACTMSITFRDFVPQTYMHVEIRGNSEL